MPGARRIEDLRRRIQEDPASIAFAQLAEEYRRAGDLTGAVDVCRAGLERHPAYGSARVTLGRALLELGALDEARLELTQVLASAPENLAALRGVADIHRQQGRLADALSLFRKALQLAPNDPDLVQAVHELTPQAGSDANRQRSERVIARLEEWLHLIHGARTHRHA